MADAPTSVNSEFKLGIQADATTPVTTGLLCGRFTRSMLFPTYTELNPGAEHGCSLSGRPTIQKSRPIRTSYVAGFSASWFLYPELIGMALVGLGFDVSSAAGAGTEYTHTFTIADRTAHKYLTVLNQWDVGASAFEHRTTGARVASLGVAGSSRGVVCNMSGVGMTYDDSAGTETNTAEPDYLLTPTDGTLTAQISGVDLFTTNPRMFQINLQNPLYLEEPPLFASQRSTLPPIGMAGNFTIGGIDLAESIWNKLHRNGASSGSPSLVIPELALTLKVESPSNITGASVPYSVQFAFPATTVRMQPFGSVGRNLLRVAIAGEMIDADSGTEPLTVTVVNTRASYP